MGTSELNLQALADYITAAFAEEDAVLRAARARMQQSGLPPINVSPSEGKLLQVLARLIGAQRILEIGTLGGYSAIWLARALPPEGKLVTLEIDCHHAEVARENLAQAGLGHKVEVRLGRAAETLRHMHAQGEPPFDLIFIDADKESYPEYFELCLPLLRRGGLLLADNALSPVMRDPQRTGGVARYNALAAARADLASIIVPMLRGEDRVDGLILSLKL
ncbi:MAG: O-methyltransferase [Anaerolineae bacterium]|nr:O-methyltransferase [Thermoflexales bacterium]MDW8395221.1 O-methyltransferase [Anaerolineae bacterium]